VPSTDKIIVWRKSDLTGVLIADSNYENFEELVFRRELRRI
jgi:hypothetical protein